MTNRRAVRLPQPTIRRPEGRDHAEIIVGIAIIVTLLLALLPDIHQAREKARQVTCLSNVQQIGMAILLYAQDYNDLLVPCQISGVGNGSIFRGAELLQCQLVCLPASASDPERSQAP